MQLADEIVVSLPELSFETEVVRVEEEEQTDRHECNPHVSRLSLVRNHNDDRGYERDAPRLGAGAIRSHATDHALEDREVALNRRRIEIDCLAHTVT